MVYRKKYGRRYRPRRVVGGRRRNAIKRWAGEKPSIVDKIASYAGPVGKIARTVSTLVSMVNTEKKYVDNATSTTTVPSTGTFIATYTTMAQGLGDSGRMGNVIKGKSISGRLVINKNSSAPRTFLRLMWVLDKECDGALPSISNILESVDVVSGINRDFSKRFAILKDAVYTLSDANMMNIHKKFYFPTDFHVHFDGATAAISDAKENQVYLIGISDQPTAVPSVTHFGRFNYYDN